MMRRWISLTVLLVAGGLAVGALAASGEQPPELGPKPVFRVTVQGGGRGAVTSSPPGIDCKPLCSGKFLRGATVILVATARAGSRFDGWRGVCLGKSSWCIVPATKDLSVSAKFVRGASASYEEVASIYVKRPILNVTRAGAQGTILSSPRGIDCPPIGTCSKGFDRGKRVTLRAIAPTGYVFVGWSGPLVSCAGNGSCAVRLDTTTEVTARFRQAPS